MNGLILYLWNRGFSAAYIRMRLQMKYNIQLQELRLDAHFRPGVYL